MRGLARGTSVIGGSLALALLCGCADGPTLPKLGDLNPFAEKAVPLPGKRIPVMQTKEVVTGELADASAPIVLPPPSENQPPLAFSRSGFRETLQTADPPEVEKALTLPCASSV